MSIKPFSDHVAHARRARGWSQDVLALRAGIHVNTVKRVEGRKNVTLVNAVALAATLELDPSVLMRQ